MVRTVHSQNMSDLQKYIDMCALEQETDQLFEMANVHSQYHGIKDVVIWVGIAPKQHGLRVKVSNVKNKFDINNNFVIQMPSLDYDPSTVASWIDSKLIEKIKRWIILNQKLLYDYETGEIDDTGYFLANISKI